MASRELTAVVERARTGDAEAYEALAREAAARLRPVALSVVRDRDMADDAVQQTLVTMWRELPRLRDAERFEAWSHRLLIRFCMRELAARRRLAGRVDELDLPSRRDEESAGLVDRDQIERGLRRLSGRHRAVVAMVYYGGLTGEETARRLGVSPGTVASRMHYALRGLRAALEADSRGHTAGQA